MPTVNQSNGAPSMVPSVPTNTARVTMSLAEYEALREAARRPSESIPVAPSVPPPASADSVPPPTVDREMRRSQAERDAHAARILGVVKASEGPLTRRDIVRLTGLPENVVKLDLYHLVGKGKVRRLGGKKNSTYRIGR